MMRKSSNLQQVRQAWAMSSEDPRARYTESVMRDSLIELLAVKPIGQITVKELCEHAGINRSTFYTHYTSIQELLTQVETETFDWLTVSLQDVKQKTTGDSILEATEVICKYIAENGKHLGVLMNQNADIEFQQTIMRLIYDEAMFDLGSEEKRMEIRFIVSGSIGLIQYWLNSGLQTPSTTIAKIIVKEAAAVNFAGMQPHVVSEE